MYARKHKHAETTSHEAGSFRQRMLDLVAEYEALRVDRDKLLNDIKFQSTSSQNDLHPAVAATKLASPLPSPRSTAKMVAPALNEAPCMLVDAAAPLQEMILNNHKLKNQMEIMERPRMDSVSDPVTTFSTPASREHSLGSVVRGPSLFSAPGSRQQSLVATEPFDELKLFSSRMHASNGEQFALQGMQPRTDLKRHYESMSAKLHPFACDGKGAESRDLFAFRKSAAKACQNRLTPRSSMEFAPSDRHASAFIATSRISTLLGWITPASTRTTKTTKTPASNRTTKTSMISFAQTYTKRNFSRTVLQQSLPVNAMANADLARSRDVREDNRGALRPARVSCADWFLGTQRGQWLLLMILGAFLICFGAVIWRCFGGNEEFDNSWIHSFWISYCLFIDPGTQTGIPASDPERIKFTASVLSLVGFCFNLSFLGMIVELVKGMLTRWKKERYRIVLTGHVLILGWTDKTLFLLTEMLKQTAKDGRQVVILAMRDEHEMMQDIRNHISGSPKLIRHVRVCQGCPFDVDDLVRVSAGSAADVVVLCRKGSNANLEMVRVMVALAALPQEVTGKVIAEVWDADAEPVLEVLLANTTGISARPAVRRLFCLMVVQPLIAHCMMALCSAEAPEELRVVQVPCLIGKTFHEACRFFSSDVCIGVKSYGSPLKITPDEDYTIACDDQFLVLGHGKHKKNQARNPPIFPVTDDRDIMICVGWCEDFVELIDVLDKMVRKTCRVYVLSEKPEDERAAALAGLELRNLVLCHRVGSCRAVQQLGALPLKEASAILVLAEASQLFQSLDSTLTGDDLATADAITTDSASLTVMVTITGIIEGLYGHERHRGTRPRIVCDVFDPRTDQLLERNSALQEHAVFFRSNALETAMFRTAAKNPVSFNALNEMLCADDSASMELVAVTSYLAPRHSLAEHLEVGELLGDQDGFSYWQMHDRVHDSVDGGLLIGWLRMPQVTDDYEDSYRQSSVVIAPAIDRNKKLIWRFGDYLLVLRVSNQSFMQEAFEARFQPRQVQPPSSASNSVVYTQRGPLSAAPSSVFEEIIPMG